MTLDTQDIYQTPQGDGSGEGPGHDVDQKMMRGKARTIRNSIVFTLLMVLMLSVTAWLIYVQENKNKRTAIEEQLAGPVEPKKARAVMPDATNAVPASALVAPDILEMAQMGMQAGDVPEKRLDPVLTARAMGEVRVANQYLQKKDWAQAEEHVRKALEIWPHMNAAQRMLGVIYTQTGQFDQAIEVLEAALKTNPFSAETFNNLATAYMHNGDMDQAEEMLLTAIQVRPGYSVAFLNLGLLYLAMGQYESAVEYLGDAIERMPEQVGARNNLAVAQLRLGQYEAARENLDILLQAQPEDAAAYFNMAITFSLEGDAAQAMEWIRRGAQYCSPVMLRKFLVDSDFDSLREYPAFQQLTESIGSGGPDLPSPPK